MKKILIGGVLFFIVVNVGLSWLIFNMTSDKADSVQGGEAEAGMTAQDWGIVTEEEKQYFSEETLPYYEDLAKELDVLWREQWTDVFMKISDGKVPLNSTNGSFMFLKTNLNSLKNKTKFIPVEQLSEKVLQEVLASVDLYKLALESRIEAADTMVLAAHFEMLPDEKMQEIIDMINTGDYQLVLSNEKFYGLSAQLGIIGSGSVESDYDIDGELEGQLDESLSGFLNELIDEKIGNIEKMVSEAIDTRIKYGDGEITLGEAVRKQDGIYADLEKLLEGYQMPPLTSVDNKELYKEIYDDFESVKKAYYEHAYAQKTLTFSMASERDEIVDDIDGFSKEDYKKFGEDAREIMDDTLDETLVFYEKISNLID